MEIIGTIHSIQELKTFDSGFMVQEFYLNISKSNQYTGEKYENYAKFQVVNQKIKLELFNLGDVVRVYFGINGKVFDRKDGGGKCFIQNLNVYKIEAYQSKAQSSRLENEQLKEMYSLKKDEELPF